MKIKSIALVAALVVALASPVLAGGYGCNKDAKASVVLAGGKGCTKDAQSCLNYMAAHYKDRGWVGLELDKNYETGVVKVERVVPGSPAEAAGFKAGDELLALNGIQLAGGDKEKLSKAKKAMLPGKNVTYTVNRNGYEKQIPVTLAELPSEVLAQWVGSHMLEHASVAIAEK